MSVASSASAGALQLALELQQGLAASVASMGAGNSALAAGAELAGLDAGGTAEAMGGASGMAVQALDAYA